MPVYDYACVECGVFTVLRPMAEFQAPHDCPDCGASSGRAFLTAPSLAGMDAGKRRAMAVNERASHEPRRSSAHGAGCSCCSGGKVSSRTAVAPSGAKSFPSARPWQISH
jgi:putative FmdB family regulatory protein